MAFERWKTARRAAICGAKTGPRWRASLETYAYPSIGALPVNLS